MNLGCIPRVLHGHATPSSTLLPSRYPRSASLAECAARAALGIAEAILRRSEATSTPQHTAMAELRRALHAGAGGARSLTAPRPRTFVGEPSDQVCTHKVFDHVGVVHVQCR